jgi:alpha-tubulin suppressor-like RCC1 family protein
MSREFVVAVAAGEYFSLMLTREGEIHGMGDSNSGQLGVQNPGSRFKTPTRIASIPARALAVAAGYQHAAAVLA